MSNANVISGRLSDAPSVWLIVGDKLGDNAQVEVVAAALGWPSVAKRMRFRERYVTGKPSFRPALYHIDRDHSDPLDPPWPDLVLTVGRRPSMAAIWVRQQSAGKTQVVIVGRPRRMLDEFALVLATPQYRLPERPNVFRLDLPLMRADGAGIAQAVATWRDRLAPLPRPLTAVFVGGPTKPFVFDAAVTRELVAAARRSTGDAGTLFVSTSRRTPEPVVGALIDSLPAAAQLYRWQPDAADNPYMALLGLADRFVVTGDSISMIVEVARLGKPLAIFPLPVVPSAGQRLKQRLAALLQPEAGTGRAGPLAWLGDRLYDIGLAAYSRDFSALHRRLIERGLAVSLGDPFPDHPAAAPDDLDRVVARIKALFPSAAGS